MSFPSDIKGCMRDCILSVLWAREDIYKFFADHGCAKTDLKTIENPAQQQISRLRMVDLIFELLSSSSDGGLGPFRAMLQSLTAWSHFDPYYFDKLKKLNRADAEQNLSHLRQLQEIRDAKILNERKARAAAEARAQTSKTSILNIRKEFLDLHAGKLKPQQRGYALQFVGKVEGKMYGRGLFVSVHGFTENVVLSVVRGKALRTVFVDGEDLVLVVEEQLTFSEMVDKKVKPAQTKGLIYVNPISGSSKV